MLFISTERVLRSEQHLCAQTLLSRALRERGIEYVPEITPLSFGEHGKPFLAEYPDTRFNLSHADGITAVMVSKNECGVDCEKLRPFDLRVMRRVCSESEQHAISSDSELERDLIFFRLWTLKEAYVKALGTGFSFPLKNAEFSFDGDNILTALTDCNFTQYIINGGFIVSVCELSRGFKPNKVHSLNLGHDRIFLKIIDNCR